MPWTVFAIGAALAAGLLLAVWMLLVEPRLFRVRRLVLDADSLGLPQLKILHMTDTHFNGRDEAALAFLARLAAAERFDLILFTGDLIDVPAGIESAARAAALFRPRLGSFAVLGGHDYAQIGFAQTYAGLLRGDPRRAFTFKNPVDRLVASLAEEGVQILEDASARAEARDGRQFAVVGLRDAFVFGADVRQAWADVPDGLPSIAIAHSPDVLHEVRARGARLAFFGHTHGGQVRFPIIGAVVTRSSLPRRLARGTFRSGGTVFVVSSGLGASGPTPFRLLCRPEVVVAELRRSASAQDLTPVRPANV